MTITSSIYAIEATKKTPTIVFDKDKGKLKISGRSLPEDSMAFYGGLFDEIERYFENPQELSTIEFRIEYLNSISSKTILHIILQFEKLLTMGKHIDIVWHYSEEDDMMFEVGEIFKLTTKIPFRLLKTMSED